MKENKLKGDYSKQVASKWKMANERNNAIEEMISPGYMMKTTKLDNVKLGLRHQLFNNDDYETD